MIRRCNWGKDLDTAVQCDAAMDLDIVVHRGVAADLDAAVYLGWEPSTLLQAAACLCEVTQGSFGADRRPRVIGRSSDKRLHAVQALLIRGCASARRFRYMLRNNERLRADMEATVAQWRAMTGVPECSGTIRD